MQPMVSKSSLIWSLSQPTLKALVTTATHNNILNVVISVMCVFLGGGGVGGSEKIKLDISFEIAK